MPRSPEIVWRGGDKAAHRLARRAGAPGSVFVAAPLLAAWPAPRDIWHQGTPDPDAGGGGVGRC